MVPKAFRRSMRIIPVRRPESKSVNTSSVRYERENIILAKTRLITTENLVFLQIIHTLAVHYFPNNFGDYW